MSKNRSQKLIKLFIPEQPSPPAIVFASIVFEYVFILPLLLISLWLWPYNFQWSTGTAKSIILKVLYSFILLLIKGLAVWPRLGDPFVCQNLCSFDSFFFYQHLLMVFHWGLSDSKSPQVSRTILSILADFANAVIWMISTRPVISKSSSPCNNLLATVPSAPITFCITVTFMFHSFF